MIKAFAILALIALVLSPVGASARAGHHVMGRSSPSLPMAMDSQGMVQPSGMSGCAEHMAKKKAECDAKCAMACASTVAVSVAILGSEISGSAEIGQVIMTIASEASPRSALSSLLERPPKRTV